VSETAPGTDLRLVPAALACWGVAGPAVGLDVVPVVVAAVVSAAAAAGCALAAGATLRRRPQDGAAVHRAAAGPAPPTARPLRSAVVASAALALVAAAITLASAAAQLHERGRGPLDDLVRERAVVEVVGTVRAEVVPLVSRWSAAAGGADGAGGASTRHRTVLAVEQVTGRGRTGAVRADLVVLGGAEWAAVPYGSTVAVTGRLSAAAPGQAPVGWLSATTVVVVRAPGSMDRAVAAVRSGLLAASDGLPPDARGLVPGAAVGDTTRVPAELVEAMRDTGLLHLTAVSGGHFAVLSLAVIGVATALRAPRALRAALAGAATAAFVLLVHPEPSVVRAAVMGGLSVLGMLLGRRGRAVPALGTAVVVLLVVDPWLSRSLGFALSVVATAAIVLVAPGWALALGRVLPRWLAVALAVPAAAQAACAPLIVLVDPAVPLYAVPANLLVAPAVPPVTLLGLASALTAGWAPGAAEALARAASWPAGWIATVARAGAELPGARLPWPGGSAGSAALVAVTVLGVAAVRGARAASAARARRTREPS